MQNTTLFDNLEQNKKVDENEILTTAEAASFLKITERSLLNMCNRGEVPYYKLGERNRYFKSELIQLLSSQPRGVKPWE
jgi:excisionase family DNA binding protein